MHFNNIPFHNYYFASNRAVHSGKRSYIAQETYAGPGCASFEYQLFLLQFLEIDTNETIIDQE